jgi:hypothetical protein
MFFEALLQHNQLFALGDCLFACASAAPGAASASADIASNLAAKPPDKEASDRMYVCRSIAPPSGAVS